MIKSFLKILLMSNSQKVAKTLLKLSKVAINKSYVDYYEEHIKNAVLVINNYSLLSESFDHERFDYHLTRVSWFIEFILVQYLFIAAVLFAFAEIIIFLLS